MIPKVDKKSSKESYFKKKELKQRTTKKKQLSLRLAPFSPI